MLLTQGTVVTILLTVCAFQTNLIPAGKEHVRSVGLHSLVLWHLLPPVPALHVGELYGTVVSGSLICRVMFVLGRPSSAPQDLYLENPAPP